MWHEQATRDLRAGDNRRGQPGNGIRAFVLIELQEIRLHRVKRVDRHAARERRLQHEPSYRAVAEPVRNRSAQDAPDFFGHTFSASRRETDVAHQREREPERYDKHDSPQKVWNAEIRRLGDKAAGDGSAQHRNAFNDFAFRQDRLEPSSFPKISGERQRIDEPGLHRP